MNSACYDSLLLQFLNTNWYDKHFTYVLCSQAVKNYKTCYFLNETKKLDNWSTIIKIVETQCENKRYIKSER